MHMTHIHIHVVSPTPSQGLSWRRHLENVYVLFKDRVARVSPVSSEDALR